MPIFSKVLGTLDANDPKAIGIIANHLRVMQEELEYRLMFLDSSNISEIDISETNIKTPEGNLYSLIGDLNGNYSKLEQTVDGFNMTVASYERTVDGYTKKVSEYEQTVDGFNMTVASYERTVDGYTKKVSEYEQTVDGFNMTVASYERTVDGYTKKVSEYEQTVDGFSQQVSSYKTTVDGYTNQVSSFQQTVNGFNTKVASYEQTVSGYTQKVSEYEQSVNGFKQTVSSYSTAVDGYAKQVSSFEQTVKGFTFSVNNGEKSSTLKLMSDGVALTSAEIKLTGMVTFNDLSTNGKTTIHGGNIQADTLRVNAANVSGTMTGVRFETSGKTYGKVVIDDDTIQMGSGAIYDDTVGTTTFENNAFRFHCGGAEGFKIFMPNGRYFQFAAGALTYREMNGTIISQATFTPV